jgi:ATP-dependent Clp protease ATP-binding subunit ClpC
MNWFKEFWKALTTPLAPVTTPLAREIPGFTEQSEDFTPRAARALVLARKEAQRTHHRFIGTEHVLLGLILLGQGVAFNVLTALGVDLEAVRLTIETEIPGGIHEEASGPIDFTPKVKRALAIATEERKALNHTYLGTEHILLGLLREGEGVAGVVLKNLGVNVKATREQILRELDPNYTSGNSEGDTPL